MLGDHPQPPAGGMQWVVGSAGQRAVGLHGGEGEHDEGLRTVVAEEHRAQDALSEVVPNLQRRTARLGLAFLGPRT